MAQVCARYDRMERGLGGGGGGVDWTWNGILMHGRREENVVVCEGW